MCLEPPGGVILYPVSVCSQAQTPSASVEPITSPTSPNGATLTKVNVGNGGVTSPVDRLDNLIANSDRNGTLRSNKEVTVLG